MAATPPTALPRQRPARRLNSDSWAAKSGFSHSLALELADHVHGGRFGRHNFRFRA